VPDTKVQTCDELLGSHKPEPGSDPLRASSDVWAEARKAIVAAQLDEANIKMCQAVALNPESAAIEGLAHLYLRLGNTKQALVWGGKADKLRPGQLDIGYLIGEAYAFQGDLEKARSIWLQTLNVPPEDVTRIPPISKDYSVEAGRHLRRGDYARAELFFRRSVILDPNNLTALIGLAKTYQKLEKPGYARIFAERSLEITDVMPEVHVLLGEMALELGNKEEARERFERALAVRPGFFPAKRGLSQVQ
jgi:tetratricopeptide (TPR) repeat protein